MGLSLLALMIERQRGTTAYLFGRRLEFGARGDFQATIGEK